MSRTRKGSKPKGCSYSLQGRRAGNRGDLGYGSAVKGFTHRRERRRDKQTALDEMTAVCLANIDAVFEQRQLDYEELARYEAAEPVTNNVAYRRAVARIGGRRER